MKTLSEGGARVLREALALGEEERAELVACLIDSLGSRGGEEARAQLRFEWGQRWEAGPKPNDELTLEA